MMFSKNVLFGSLSFATVLMMGNGSGAIAQSQRYPTDLELDSLFTKFAQSIQWHENDKVGSGYVRDRRTDAQKESLNSFIRSWSVGNSEIAPFLGSWQGYEDQITVYPSNTKNRVCIISTGEGMGRFYLGNISKGKIYTNNNTVLFRQGRYLGDAVVIKGEPRLLGELPHNSPRPLERVEEFVNSRVGPQYRPEIIIQKYRDAGCTASLPSNNQTQVSTQELQNLPDGNYAYREVKNSSSRRDSSRYLLFKKSGNFVAGSSFYPRTDGEYCFSGQLQDSSVVNITTASQIFDRYNKGETKYEFGKGKPVDLSNYQKVSIAKVEEVYPFSTKGLQKCIDLFPSLNSSTNNSIPSVPLSSTPVKPTDTIAKYPTNDDFEKVDRILQASSNPESLVNLKGNQQDQRRKFQKEWESRNPAAAKFLGSWYTGGKSFYVYPSTSKGGTCVITKDNQGNLDLQIGAVLNKELRYGGGKGFFWIDRENIIASRDSNSGDLYPIYATSEVPELSEITISNMESQKCITTLPIDSVASSLPSPLYEDVIDPANNLGNLYRINGITKTFRVGLNAFDITDNGQTVKLSSKVKPNVPTIIITHGWNNNPSSPDFRNLLKAVRYNSSIQVLVVDWGQGANTGVNLDIASSRIEATASKVADLIKKYQLKPNDISLIGHSLGAHLSVNLALELQNRKLGNVKSITLLDPAIDMPAGYQVKALSDVSSSTFIRAFYTSPLGSSSFAASANESYNIKYPVGARLADYSHGEALTLLANSFQGDSKGNRNCIAERFIKLEEQFPNMPQNTNRQRGEVGTSIPVTDLYVAYGSNGWLYPKQIVRGLSDVDPEKGKCKLESDAVRTFDSIQNILK